MRGGDGRFAGPSGAGRPVRDVGFTRPGPAGAQPPRRGRPPGYSLEQILDATVAILDEGGEPALTFRSLAAALGSGVGSLYWYVRSKDELLDRATDVVLQGVLDATTALPADPYAAMRELADAFYAAMQEHPWVAAFLMRDAEMQPASMGLYERFGRQVQQLDLTTRQRFHAVSALVSYVVGVGAEMQEPPPEVIAAGQTQAEALRAYADIWRSLPAEEFPFVHEVADEFERHHDVEQFRAGVELILSGIRVQTGTET